MPTPLSLTFVGRQLELSQLSEWLADPDYRVISLVGPGGIGKTRLAQQVAAQAQTAFAQGMAYVPLASLVSGEFFFPAIAETLGFSFYGGEDPAIQLVNYLFEKQLLLVFDSFEQALVAVPWVSSLVQQSSQLKVLITSRQQPGIPGERVLAVSSMAFPESDTAEDFDEAPAVRLFVQNARLLNPFYEIQLADRPYVRRICEMVGGLPLAIQMAAAWTRAISCEQIAAEIAHDMDFLRAPFRSMPERQQSLKAIFDSSWRMLPYAERVICRRLAVFHDSFCGEAALQVAGASEEQLISLVNHSLLQRNSDDTFRLHTTVRQYAAARLNQDAEEARQTRQRHAAYFTSFLYARNIALKGSQQCQSLSQIAAVVGDVQQAWEFLAQERDFAALQQCAEGMYLFFTLRGRARAGWHLFENAVNACQSDNTCPVETQARMMVYQAIFALERNENAAAHRLSQACLTLNPPLDVAALAHHTLGRLATLADEHGQAIRHLQLSLDLYTQLEDAWGQARVLDSLGAVSWTLGDFASAEEYFNRCLVAQQVLGGQQGIASALDHLGVVARDQGDLMQARTYFEQSLVILKDLDARLNQAYVANHLGGVLAMQGDLAAAEPHFQEGITLGREIGEQRIVAYTLNDWAMLIAGDPQQRQHAQSLFTEALSIFEKLDERFGLIAVLLGLGSLVLISGDHAGAKKNYQTALRIAVEIENPRLINDVLHSIGQLLHQQGELERAVRLYAFLAANESPNWQTSSQQQTLDALRAKLSADNFEQAVAQGQAGSLENILVEFGVSP